MATESVKFVETWFEEVWRKGNLDAIDEMLAPDAVMHGLGGMDTDVAGPEGFKPFVLQLRGAFPDIEVHIEQTVEQGDLIASRWVATMTHQGDHLGPVATNRRVQVTGMSIARLKDGKMIEGWNNWDTMAMMQQIGALTPNAVLMP